MRISTLFLVCGSLALSNAALAQNATGDSATTSEITIISSFDQLSSGNQKIAESLFAGQIISGDGAGEALSLDQIAVMKNGQGWGRVFREMKAGGLVEAKNLGQLVSGRNRSFKPYRIEKTAEINDGGAATGGEMPDPDVSAETLTGNETPETPPELGAFDQLSPGNRKIAESLFEEQAIPDNSTGEALNLDQIALLKQEQGWGQIFKQMKSDGLVEASNLGQLVSGRNRAAGTFASGGGTRFGTVMTTGSGRIMSFGKPGRNSSDNGAEARPVARWDITASGSSEVKSGEDR